MQDLARKVPYGTPLRHFFAAKEYQPQTFAQWLQMVQQFQSGLERSGKGRQGKDKTRDAIRAASEAQDEPDEPEVEDDPGDEEVDPWDEEGP